MQRALIHGFSIVGLALGLGTSAVKADAVPFYERSPNSIWEVTGLGKTKNNAYARCAMRTYGPGMALSIDRDLDDGENLMWLTDRKTTFHERDGDTAFMSFEGKQLPNGGGSGPIKFNIIGPNLVVFRKLPDAFFDLVGRAAVMEIRFPGTIAPFRVDMDGTSKAIGYMNDCIRLYRHVPQPKEVPRIDPHVAPSTVRSRGDI